MGSEVSPGTPGGKKRGRKPATGRYDTRAELEEWVWRWWDVPNMKQSQIARACRVSEPVVASILNQGRKAA